MPCNVSFVSDRQIGCTVKNRNWHRFNVSTPHLFVTQPPNVVSADQFNLLEQLGRSSSYIFLAFSDSVETAPISYIFSCNRRNSICRQSAFHIQLPDFISTYSWGHCFCRRFVLHEYANTSKDFRKKIKYNDVKCGMLDTRHHQQSQTSCQNKINKRTSTKISSQ